MSKKIIFTGIATALITPFKGQEIDFDKFGRLIDWQIEEGIDTLLVCGTTGVCSTMSDQEHRSVIEFAVDRVNGRVPLIAGSGSN
ncbi:MAG: dihydrodipicolinate synthase family protein, partial [Synergistaceae bacterium]